MIGEGATLEISTCTIVNKYAIFFIKEGEYYSYLHLELLKFFLTIVLDN